MATESGGNIPFTPINTGPISATLRTEVLEAAAETMVSVMQQYNNQGMTHDQLVAALIQLGQVWEAFR